MQPELSSDDEQGPAGAASSRQHRAGVLQASGNMQMQQAPEAVAAAAGPGKQSSASQSLSWDDFNSAGTDSEQV